METNSERADRRVFALDDTTWDQLQALLDRPPVHKPELTRLMTEPSVLEPQEP